MCRFAAYLGPEISIASLTTLPEHSIVKQSYKSREREEPLNGDGFGVGWYAPGMDEPPATYRAVTPAWNDENLIDLARVTKSGCIFAHVRAATPGLGVSPFNCHPFTGERFTFMHNGYLAQFDRIERKLRESLPDQLWNHIRCTTDSELLFALFRMHHAQTEGGAASRLDAALRATLEHVRRVSEAQGLTEAHQLNLCVTNGVELAVTRYCSDPETAPNSLYLHAGRQYVCEAGVCRMVEPDERGGSILIASERLSSDAAWQPVPAQHIVIIDAQRQPEITSLVA